MLCCYRLLNFTRQFRVRLVGNCYISTIFIIMIIIRPLQYTAGHRPLSRNIREPDLLRFDRVTARTHTQVVPPSGQRAFNNSIAKTRSPLKNTLTSAVFSSALYVTRPLPLGHFNVLTVRVILISI